MLRACVSPVVPQVVSLPRARAGLQLAPEGSAFVGRDRELGELVAAVAAGAQRVWIAAESGVGKTELLVQLVGRCRERGMRDHWLAPHEPATPAVLRAIADELGRAPGPRDRRRLLVIDDFSRLRSLEPWFVERFLPALPETVTVVVADRAGPVWPAGGDGVALALAPLGDGDALRYLALRGVAEDHRAEIVAAADGIPAILAAAADAADAMTAPATALRPLGDAAARFYVRHDTDDHRLAIAVLVAARTTPYELLELAFDDPHAARDAHAWLSRLSVVEHTEAGLRPDTLLRKAWERELAAHAPALWQRARGAVRAFADHRIAMAREPQRWLVDRLFVDRDAPALRAYATLPAADPGLTVAPLGIADRSAVAGLAAAQHGRRGAVAIEHWLDDDRATFDVLRDRCGAPCGYLCTVAITAAAEPPVGDPAIDQCVAHLSAIGWFGLATPPDARALVVRDWTVAGAHQAPSAGAALMLAQIAARLVTTPAVELQFVVTEQPAAWQRLAGFLGLTARLAGEHRSGDRRCSVVAIDWRGVSLPQVLHAASQAVAAHPVAPVTLPIGTRPLPIDATTQRIATFDDPAIARGSEASRGDTTDEAGTLSAALDRRVAQLARSAALSPREHEVLQLLLLGRNCAEIGIALQITARTARFHQTNLLDKLGAESRHDLVRLLL
jgi:DNA-binding CsgD family transcriptional regulator